ncbi:Raucaffricine beta-glucosidase [Handroanthus impetiginosus]|uniref:Raucaffricine beta-glucosidase n=1 Tax=Handroanthus impetiginosus TaxID=429701 RepID=A0A2G9GGQ4_9LAMI|nr:Raucaffricine beta-glucosidase [Handroanthus impetiginosus]
MAAARRAVDFMLGWFLDPVLYGRYPRNMVDFVPPENLAPFTPAESQMLKGSVDYVGINFYTSNYVTTDPTPEGVGYDADMRVEFHVERNGKPIGDPNTYPNIPPIYITENGTIYALLVRDCFPFQAGQDKVDVRGYIVWSWCDNFEWAEGYTARFGTTYFINNQTRYPKHSALWFAKFLRGKPSIVPHSNKRSIEEDSKNVPDKRLKAL